MLSALAVFIELGALAVWGVIYSLIRKAVSSNENVNPIPELIFLSVYTTAIIWVWVNLN